MVADLARSGKEVEPLTRGNNFAARLRPELPQDRGGAS
jgi:hypothetical protein